MARRIVSGLALGLLCVATGCTAGVLEGLDEPEANDLVVALAGAGIAADKVGRAGRFGVEVDRADFAAAWQVARAAGLPRPRAESGRGFLPSPGAREAQRQAETARAIAGLLRADPGIDDARVVLSASGAAVAVRGAEPEALDTASIEARIRAVAGLAPGAPVVITADATPRTHVSRPTPRSRAPLALASAAVALMLAACAAVWRRARS